MALGVEEERVLKTAYEGQLRVAFEVVLEVGSQYAVVVGHPTWDLTALSELVTALDLNDFDQITDATHAQ